MSDGVQLLIPFAAALSPGCVQALQGLALPNLEKLLSRLARAETDPGDEHTLSMPHDRVLARACALPVVDGAIPWAAWQVRQSGRDPGDAAWACITPCHWRVGSDHVALDPPEALALDEAASLRVLGAMKPFFEEDGIALEYHSPTLWLARGDIFRDLPTPSLDRVIGRRIDDWMPRTPQARAIRRLQQEMQMLLYTHAISEERQAQGQLPVNSFWVSGCGVLPAGSGNLPAHLVHVESLRPAALREDWDAWAQAWRQVDATECLRLRQALENREPVALTLCGERSASTWTDASGGLLRRIGSTFSRTRASAILETL